MVNAIVFGGSGSCGLIGICMVIGLVKFSEILSPVSLLSSISKIVPLARSWNSNGSSVTSAIFTDTETFS